MCGTPLDKICQIVLTCSVHSEMQIWSTCWVGLFHYACMVLFLAYIR